MPAFELRYHRGGVHLPELGLWLDARERQMGAERVFVSHAHTDHIGRHREVILTEATAQLMRARLSGRRQENLLAFSQRTQLTNRKSDFRITLLPAGHIFGSAMAFIETDGETLLYTGDFKLRRGLSAERCEPRRADILIMETTFGRPEYRFPPVEEVFAKIIDFCREGIAQDEMPVLLGYSLGKSQDLLLGLADAGLPVLLHEQAVKLTRIHEQFGSQFPPYGKFTGARERGKVLICPPTARNAEIFREREGIRTAVVTGWAVESSCRYRYGVDAAFPLSDHADFDELIEFVKLVNPKKVYTLHGFAADFAGTLRELSFDAQALSEDEQLTLPFSCRSQAAT